MFDTVRHISSGRFVSRGEWQHPHRTVSSHELILMVEGEAHISVQGIKYDLQAGDMLFIPAGAQHQGEEVSTRPVSFYWMHFSGEADLLLHFLHLADFSRAEILCRQLLHYASTAEYPADCADCLLRVILMEVLMQQSAEQMPANSLCSQIEEWIRINSDRPIRVTDVARHFGFHPDYLNRLFRRHHRDGLKAYIDERRLERIKRDLSSTSLTLQEIARKYGFAEYKYFLKYFRLHEQITPTEYRNAFYKTHLNWQ